MVGIALGERRVVFTIDAKSHEELDGVIKSLPFWAMTKTRVTPLSTFERRLSDDKDMIKNFK